MDEGILRLVSPITPEEQKIPAAEAAGICYLP